MSGIKIVEDSMGEIVHHITKKMEPVRRFTLSNENNMSVQLISYGATITSLKIPDNNGKIDDIMLGFDNIENYSLGLDKNPYLGCTVGRVCSRVGQGEFMLNGEKIVVSKNFLGKHQLHGGNVGFSKVNWDVKGTKEDGVIFQYKSPDGEEGYPGEVLATATYTLTPDNCFSFCYEAETTKPTPINMTNHAYFNLAGHNTGKNGLSEHTALIHAAQLTDMDEETVPNGKMIDLNGHVLDLRTQTQVGEGLTKIEKIAKGYDHNYVLDWKKDDITMQAQFCHPPSGRCMEISSNQPCMHFYTAHNMPDIKNGASPTIMGKDNTKYEKHSSFCAETHWYPDAVNHSNFPANIINPGEKYCHMCIFKFKLCCCK